MPFMQYQYKEALKTLDMLRALEKGTHRHNFLTMDEMTVFLWGLYRQWRIKDLARVLRKSYNTTVNYIRQLEATPIMIFDYNVMTTLHIRSNLTLGTYRCEFCQRIMHKARLHTAQSHVLAHIFTKDKLAASGWAVTKTEEKVG